MAGNSTKSDSKLEPQQQYSSPDGVNYNSYLKVEELTRLQVCLSNPPHHDEPLFIIIHQAYELWFKLILHELDTIFELLAEKNVRRASFFLRRITTIQRLLVQQIHILETMSPKDFLGFRDNLNPASGFQSSQFREIEFIGGLKDTRLLEHFKADVNAYVRIQKRYESPSLGDAFYDLLRKEGFKLPIDQPGATEEELKNNQEQRIKELLKLYDDNKYAELHDFAELLIDFDELIYLWRSHHVTVVERIIGFKQGTGGSEGVGYLRSTLVKRCFPDLWKLRTFMEL